MRNGGIVGSDPLESDNALARVWHRGHKRGERARDDSPWPNCWAALTRSGQRKTAHLQYAVQSDSDADLSREPQV